MLSFSLAWWQGSASTRQLATALPCERRSSRSFIPCTRLQAAILALLVHNPGRQLCHEAPPLCLLRVRLPGRQREQQHGGVGHAAGLPQAAPPRRQVAPVGSRCAGGVMRAGSMQAARVCTTAANEHAFSMTGWWHPQPQLQRTRAGHCPLRVGPASQYSAAASRQ